MVKTCIICKKPAGSGEHVFPASFGGRRINNGIYCEKHNNAFSRHVVALLAGVDIFNALVGVVPDRKDEVRPAPANSADGEQFLVTGANVTLAPPPSFDQTPELLGKQIQIDFANQAQAKKWIEEQERAGYKVNAGVMSEPETKIFGEALHAKRSIGDENFMRGLLYLGLTFVAHTDPELARSVGLAEVRSIVEKDSAVEDRVLWEPPATLAQISATPYTVGHTVVTGPDTSEKRLVALISLYGALNFGLDLGRLAKGDVPDRVTTHIDPLARRPPHDVQVTRERAIVALSTVDESKKYLKQLRAGEVEPLSEFLRDASDREVLEASRAMLKEIKKNVHLPFDEQISKILMLISVHDQRIFNWMRICFVDGGKTDPEIPEVIRNGLQSLVATDVSGPKGLTQESAAALELAKALLTDQIVAELRLGALDDEKLASLIGGAEGIRIVTSFFINIILKNDMR